MCNFFNNGPKILKLIVRVRRYISEADLEGACGACAPPPPPPLKFAKHMLYNVN